MKTRRLRIIPPKYSRIDIKVDKPNASKVFLRLYEAFGKPFKTEYLYRYIVKHREIIADIRAPRGGEMEIDVYISPYLQSVIERKKVKIANIIARDINIRGVAYSGMMDDRLFYAVRRRNDELKARFIAEYGEDYDLMREKCLEAIGADVERLNAPATDYVPEVTEMLDEILYGKED